MHLKTKINTILTFCILIVFASCNGQERPNSTKNSESVAEVTTKGKARTSRGLIQDKSGNFWFCNGRNEGVTVYDGKKFTHYTEKDGLSSNFVYTILEDNSGKLWLGTADGITCYDGTKFTIIPITSITGDSSYHKTMPDPNYGYPRPEKNWVNCIMQDRDGMFWIGTMTGVYRYDGKTSSHFSINDGIINNTGIPVNGAESIFQDNNGNIWFGGRGTEGVFRYDGKTLSNFKPDNKNWVYPLMQDKEGNIWFSKRTRGVFSYDGKTFMLIGENEFSDFFFSMEQDSSGNFWFGQGKNGGVTFYDGKTFINYSTKDGICNAFLRKIIKDKDGNIWFNCDKNGLSSYNGKTFTIVSE